MFLFPILFFSGRPKPESVNEKTYAIGGEKIDARDVPPVSLEKAIELLRKENEVQAEGCNDEITSLSKSPVWKVDYGYKYLVTITRTCSADAEEKNKTWDSILMVFDDDRRGTSMLVDFDPETNIRLNRVGAPVLPESSFGESKRAKQKPEGSLYFEDVKKIEAERGDKEYIKVLRRGHTAYDHFRFVRFIRKGATVIENGTGFPSLSPLVLLESTNGEKTQTIWPLCDPEVVDGCVTAIEFVSEPPPGPVATFPDQTPRRRRLPYEPVSEPEPEA